MRPLADWQPGKVIGVFTDIDDTLTTEGAIDAAALQALTQLKQAGLHVVAITGRPVGWSAPFAQHWPVDAIVAENGAVALTRQDNTMVRKRHQQDATSRAAHFSRMQEVLARIEREVPGARRARDSAGRETDIAIDHSEFIHLPQAAIDHVVRLMQAEGMTATVSSIHINGWFGAHDKFVGARWIVRELFDRELEAELAHWVCVGDSPNDQVMFRHFENSVGVANIRRFEAQLQYPPRYITQHERGAGFAELASHLLRQRT